MSYKDARDLAEQLKLLGFPGFFPLQALSSNFGSLASFYVVAEVLQWLAGLLDPGAVLSGGVETEDQRVLLIRSATEFFVTKSAIKLNPRKLYAASAATAAELQKVTRLLIAPSHSNGDREDEENYQHAQQIDIGDKMDDLRHARELSSELTQRGAALYDLLSKETNNKEARLAQANRHMELSSVERTLKNAIAASQVKLQSSRAQLENARVEMNALNSKLTRKRGELERTKQRLEALQKIRPAHMQEFEDCERELQELFQKYFLRIHVRDALRAQLEARTKRTTPTDSPVLQKPAETSIPFMPEGLIEDDDDEDNEDELDVSVAGDGSGDGGGGGGVLRKSKFGLDTEIPDIRDEDAMLRRTRNGNPAAAGQRPSTATSRTRPTTGRGRKPLGAAKPRERRGRAAPAAAAKNDDNNEDSSFGSSDSDLDMNGIIGINRQGTVSSSVEMLANMGSEMGGVGDEDFDLNSMEDISISKITGELPLRPKTANKPEHHSDEDF